MNESTEPAPPPSGCAPAQEEITEVKAITPEARALAFLSKHLPEGTWTEKTVIALRDELRAIVADVDKLSRLRARRLDEAVERLETLQGIAEDRDELYLALSALIVSLPADRPHGEPARLATALLGRLRATTEEA